MLIRILRGRDNMRYYLSHSIRGKYGKDATPVQMKENCDRIKEIAQTIRAQLDVELYVPAEHENFVYIAFKDKYLTEHQVLEIDCKIIDGCDGVIVYSPEDDPVQGGRAVELEYARATNRPVYVFEYVTEVLGWLASQIMRT